MKSEKSIAVLIFIYIVISSFVRWVGRNFIVIGTVICSLVGVWSARTFESRQLRAAVTMFFLIQLFKAFERGGK